MGAAPPPSDNQWPVYAQPEPPGPTKEEPWGQEDPLLWSASRARTHAIWGSAAIALFVLMFGLGMYALFTAAIYEGTVEGHPSLILLLLSPFLLAIVGAVAAGAMARNVGRMARQPLAPTGSRMARGTLWFSVFLWIMLLIVFPLSLTVTTQPDNPDENAFPIGIVTVLPIYIGFSLAVYATGASYAAWSRDNKLECLLIIGLAWAAFAMFLLLPAVIGSWNLEAETPDVNWDSAVWWLRFGSLFPAIAPWLIVVGLYFVHTRSISLIEADLEGELMPPSYGVPDGATSAESCPSCGGNLSVHPKTLEVFCAACGWGLRPETEAHIVVDPTPAPTHADDLFVEQTPSATDPGYCRNCGTKMAILTKTQQAYCPGCGAGLSGQDQQPTHALVPEPTPIPAPVPAAAPAPSPAAQPVPAFVPAPVTPHPPAPAHASATVHTPVHPPDPGAATMQAQAGTPAPAQSPQPPAPGKCPICGAMLALHPRTGERFCPACGAGLRPEQ